MNFFFSHRERYFLFGSIRFDSKFSRNEDTADSHSDIIYTDESVT